MKPQESNTNVRVEYRGVGGSLFLLCIFLSTLYGGVSYGQDRCEDIRYKDCVPMFPGESFPCLTKAGIEDVKSYYRTAIKKMQGDRELVETSTKGNQGAGSIEYRFHFRSNVQGIMVDQADAVRIQSIDEHLYWEEIKKSGTHRVVSAPFGELERIALSGQSGYTRKDYDNLATQYRHLHHSYFREVQVSPDETKPEDQAIYEKYYATVYGVPISKNVADKPGELNAEKRKKMEETAKKIKELHAQGKTREAMELAAQMQKDMTRGTTGEKLSQRGMSKEAWKLWVQCLEELHTAAYRTLISCAGL